MDSVSGAPVVNYSFKKKKKSESVLCSFLATWFSGAFSARWRATY